MPEGRPDDDPGKETVYGLGMRENEIFPDLLDTQGVEVYPDAFEMLNKWKERGLKLAVISSNRNCRQVLESAALLDLFDGSMYW